MPTKEIIKDSKKYVGKYVATKSFRSNEVICADVDPREVLKCAREQGAKNPVIVFIPTSKSVHIY